MTGIILTIIILTIIQKAMNRKALLNKLKAFKFSEVMGTGYIRNDSAGDGYFGSKRSGGKTHKGVDFLVDKGDNITSPIEGKVRYAYPYTKPDGSVYKKWGGVAIKGTGAYNGIEVKIFYLNPKKSIIDGKVKPGEKIGTAQAISEKYPGQGMENHIHVEMKVIGKIVNPQQY